MRRKEIASRSRCCLNRIVVPEHRFPLFGPMLKRLEQRVARQGGRPADGTIAAKGRLKDLCWGRRSAVAWPSRPHSLEKGLLMPVSRRVTAAIAAALLATTAACITDPETGERHISKQAIGAGVGAVGGYLLGDLIGGRNDRAE